MRELTIEATVGNIPVITDFVDRELEALACPLKAQMQIDMAVDEVFSNIAFYAYHPETGDVTVRIETEEDPLSVVLTFIDHGIPYNPLERKDPDVSLPVDERPVGGLGIFLVKKVMDGISYEHRDGRNILILKKVLRNLQ